ncbi:MAG: glycosyltransferase family 4 protein, partial [Alphaproteobacteria bacterium]
MATNAAFYHHPDGVATERPKLMGRHMAGAGFLTGYARHADVPRLYAYTQSAEHFADFERRVIAANPAAAPRVHIPRDALARVAEPGCLSVPSPTIGSFAWARRHRDQRAYSLCGVFHTTMGAEPMDAIGALVTAPVQSWDAVVCPSQAIRRTVEHVLGTWCDHLGSLAGAQPSVAVQLPVIPLGVDADAFAGSEAARVAARVALGIGADDVVVLFVGRLSYHAKANPYPLFVALEDAAARVATPVRLVMAGWFANESIEAHFRSAARALCRRVAVSFVDGRTEAGRSQPWHAADVFASLVDNPQETFGLTPLEAMAAGLPVVAADWDGYRESVRHGVDGFLVPTVTPEPGAGADLARRYHLGVDSYDRYIGGTAMAVAVDIGAATEAFARLIGDAELRRRMGAAGRARARADFDWGVVVRRYQDLWAALAER